MKTKLILTAFIGMLTFVGMDNVEAVNPVVLPVDHTIPVFFHVIRADRTRTSPEMEGVVIGYTGLESVTPQFYEAVIPASTQAECLASRDLSRAVRISPERASLTYDVQTNTSALKWWAETTTADSCRVLVVRRSTGEGDYGVWRSNFGQTAARTESASEKHDGEATAAPQRSRVTSLAVTFNTVATVP